MDLYVVIISQNFIQSDFGLMINLFQTQGEKNQIYIQYAKSNFKIAKAILEAPVKLKFSFQSDYTKG